MRHTASGTPAHAPTAHTFTPQYPAGPYQADRRVIYHGEGTARRALAEVFSGACRSLAEADAAERLFAAAPALHAALRAALVVVAGCNADGAYSDQEHAIRAALDLAEGGAA
jgi:hypothetical protein